MSVIKRNLDARAKIKSATSDKLTAKQRELVLALLTEGGTITEVCARADIPRIGVVWNTCDADKAFAGQLKEAMTKGAATMLAEAHDNARDAGTSADPDKARIADMYTRCTASYVEKVAPREYGQLVKLAGDADQAALQVSIVSFKPDAPADSESSD